MSAQDTLAQARRVVVVGGPPNEEMSDLVGKKSSRELEFTLEVHGKNGERQKMVATLQPKLLAHQGKTYYGFIATLGDETLSIFYDAAHGGSGTVSVV
jgi:hypothetical protein